MNYQKQLPKIKVVLDIESFNQLVELLRNDAEIIVTIFNPKEKECNLLVVSNEENTLLENHIKDILEMEVL